MGLGVPAMDSVCWEPFWLKTSVRPEAGGFEVALVCRGIIFCPQAGVGGQGRCQALCLVSELETTGRWLGAGHLPGHAVSSS